MDEQPVLPASSCPDQEVLQRFLLGRLPPAEVERLAEHVERCPACIVALRTFEERDTLLEAMEQPLPPPGPALQHDLLAGLLSRLEHLGTVPPLPPGQLPQVPGYEVLEELGRGSMGVVYKARHRHLNRLVALKMILAGGHAGAEERVRFLAEAEAIAAVKHTGIVQVYDFGTHDGLPFFSLELCEGGSLAARLAGNPLPPREAAQLVEQVARAVQAAHDKGIVHRDLKPGNVLLARSTGSATSASPSASRAAA
jgi:serine/threonine protein kinase